MKNSASNGFQLQNRRYIGSKYKLLDWIFDIISKECSGRSFADIFAGTGIIADFASQYYDSIFVNDFLYSNEVIYKAFFGGEKWDTLLVTEIINNYNQIDSSNLSENYFSYNFGNKFFSMDTAKKIGYIREDLQKLKKTVSEKEYYILLASLIYSTDKIANTVGHYDAYIHKNIVNDQFKLKIIIPNTKNNFKIFREDANSIAQTLIADIVYIDPPYNSRQYSRFYHVLETLTKWDKPQLSGIALKPPPENISDYCKVSARDKLSALVKDLQTKYIVLSYNNTYNSKSGSSKNKITLEQIEDLLQNIGKTKVFSKEYRHFNAGNTMLDNHKEYLFVTQKYGK